MAFPEGGQGPPLPGPVAGLLEQRQGLPRLPDRLGPVPLTMCAPLAYRCALA